MLLGLLPGVRSRNDQAFEPRLSMPELGQLPLRQLPFSHPFQSLPRT